MDLPLLIRKLEEASQYADRAWKEDRHYPFLDLSLVCEEAAKRLREIQYPSYIMAGVDLDLQLTPGGYIQYNDAPNR
jgi:hypothetical protein